MCLFVMFGGDLKWVFFPVMFVFLTKVLLMSGSDPTAPSLCADPG